MNTNKPIMKTGAYVCADAALAGQCTIKGMNRQHTCLKWVAVVPSMTLTLEMAMTGMTVLLESLFKLARRIRAASILLQLVSPACRMMVESIPSSDALHNAPLFMFRLLPIWNCDCVLVCSFFVHCPPLYLMGQWGSVNVNGISNSSHSLFLSSSSGASRPLP